MRNLFFMIIFKFTNKGSLLKEGTFIAVKRYFINFLFVALFLISSSLIMPFNTLKAATNSPELNQALQFLCGFDICVATNFSVYYKDNMEHRGFFTSDPPEIWIDSSLSSVNKKLMFVHELIHVFRHEHSSKEVRWLEEGLSKFWEYKFSNELWPVSYNDRFKKNPVFFLSENEHFYGREGDGYISSFFFVYYLYRYYGGMTLINKILKSNQTGWNNITQAIKEIRDERLAPIPPPELSTPIAIIKHLSVALWVNDLYGAKYGLFYLNKNFEPPSADIKLPTFSDWNSIFKKTKSKLNKIPLVGTYISFNAINQNKSYFSDIADIIRIKNNSALFSLLDYNPVSAEFYDSTKKYFEISSSSKKKVIIEAYIDLSK